MFQCIHNCLKSNCSQILVKCYITNTKDVKLLLYLAMKYYINLSKIEDNYRKCPQSKLINGTRAANRRLRYGRPYIANNCRLGNELTLLKVHCYCSSLIP